MGASDPKAWARDKRSRLRAYVDGEVGEWAAKARDVCLPGVPVAALLGFAANGKPKTNTTGWIVGDQRERDEALRKGRKPLGGDPREGYGHVGSDDLHELDAFGVEGSRCPTPCATGDSPWVAGARSESVRKVLGRAGVEGGDWYGATADAVVIGVWNVRRHVNAARRKLAELDQRLSWESDEKPITAYMLGCGSMSWSAGSGGLARHFAPYAATLAALPEAKRLAEFDRLASLADGGKNRHGDDEWTALRRRQKEAGAALCAPWIAGEPWALEWMADGLTAAERDALDAALVKVAR